MAGAQFFKLSPFRSFPVTVLLFVPILQNRDPARQCLINSGDEPLSLISDEVNTVYGTGQGPFVVHNMNLCIKKAATIKVTAFQKIEKMLMPPSLRRYEPDQVQRVSAFLRKTHSRSHQRKVHLHFGADLSSCELPQWSYVIFAKT